ncbi:MAG: Hpt domain-containing protein, partial [Defluviitaleaceae bacterium]|nr:Hpt domain-containing protein [Defluviitaleaceae bacterium]
SQKIKNFAGRATEFDERSQPIARRPEDSLSFPIKKIDGVNVEKGLARMGGDKDAYIFVLRSYAKNTPPLLDAAQKINPENLTDYATIVHGIRGSSGGINADEIALLAGELENAALAGDFDFAASHNEKFIAAARKLIENISQMLAEIDAENKKPQKNKPDEKILADLRQACTDFEMSGVDAALDALETFEYETDGELVAWLRENAEQMNFDEIIKKLSELC